ncbi:ABC transporter ATP-binding protein [Staphylococcus hominis]|uniref:ABC transporter ATP-binding protein n=1 Tax=Staphylococcus hominis TaxID=1290 RepID=UPI001F574D50|nr:ABC transporter ATP-binding protein [Staphylococcus hominis]MCI2902506.1 ABC transporter ATP-binding protein/permease [Staphylococcus hominis]
MLLAITIIVSLLGSVSGLLIPFYTGKLVDNFDLKNIDVVFVLFFIFIFFLNALFSGISLYLLNKIGEKVIYRIRTILWKHIIELKIPFFDENESGQLMSRLTDDTKNVNYFVSYKLPNLLPSILSIFGSLIILFIMDWKMSLIISGLLPLYLIVILPLGKIMQKVTIRTQTEIAKFSGLLGRVLTEIRLVKVSNTQREELNKADGNLLNIYDLGLKQAKVSAVIQPLSSIVMLLTVGIILSFGGMRVASGVMSAGTLVTMIFYIFQLSMPLVNVSTLITDYKKAVGSSQKIYEILQEEKEKVHGFNSIEDSDIIFQDVEFSYGNNKVLNKINLNILNNKVTAIVGPSGAGKTTIFNLIERMYYVEKGEILHNNNSIYDYDLYKWRSKIGYVMQTNAMMNGTIKENILYGVDRKVSNNEMLNIMKNANCLDFINSLENGYDTFVGEKGIKLSGGQKQRIDIARCFAKNPDILLLDEATANLDSRSERKIQEAFDTLMSGRTTVIIAHRLSTVKKADQIIFLEDGVVTGAGKHKDLMNSHELYNQFVMNQELKDDV